MTTTSKRTWTILWLILGALLLGGISLLQTKAETAEGFIARRMLPPGSIIGADDIVQSKSIAINEERVEQIIKEPKDIVGKVAVLGFAPGEPITDDKLRDTPRTTREFTVSTNMGNIPHPMDSLKLCDIWVDYNPKEYPGSKPEKIVSSIPIKSIRNRKTTEVSESDDKVPAIVVVEATDETIAKIREYSRMGTLFFTNPYPAKEGAKK